MLGAPDERTATDDGICFGIFYLLCGSVFAARTPFVMPGVIDTHGIPFATCYCIALVALASMFLFKGIRSLTSVRHRQSR
jgi:hypothetical protein